MSSFVPHPLDDGPPPLEEPCHPERPQDPEANLVISEMLQVAVNTILATLYFIVTLLFRVATGLVPDPLDDTLPVLGEQASHPEHLQDPAETHFSGVQQVMITAIRATDLTLGLRRTPAGFHVVVNADGIEFQTSNKHVHVDQGVVEWNEQILLPCEPSSLVRVNVYASFELDPMLGHGDVLRIFEISVEELLDRSKKSRPIIFQPKQEEVVSPCTSLFMTVEQRRSDENDATVLQPLTTLTSNDMDALVLQTDAGHGLLARYRRTQISGDLNESITHFERASDLCAMDHPCRPVTLFNLAAAKFVSCQADGTHPDLDIPICLFRDTLALRSTGHPDRPITQLHLAIALLSRFAKRGCETDADAAEELLSEVLDVCHANSHISRAALLAIDTFALHRAGGMDGYNVGQMQAAASMLPLSPNQLADRGERCLQRDDPHDLDEVISFHYDALRYYDTGHDCRWQLLCNLGTLLVTRFRGRGNSQDLDKAIMLFSEALNLCPDGHQLRPMSLNKLASALSTRFEHRGNDQDLEDAIMLHRDALALHIVGDPDRYTSLNNLANVLFIRLQQRGNDQDLDNAFMLYRDALALRPVGHPDRFMSLNNLANVLFTRFLHRGNDQDLDDAFMLYRDALALHPVGHPDRSMPLNNLANVLSTRFQHRGNDQDLDDAIMLHRDALALHPVGHPGRSGYLRNVANVLFTRFEHRGNDQDLDDAIMLHKDALALYPVGHPDRSKSLNNLASALSIRFQHRGNDQDLDDAIMLHRDALAFHIVGHPDLSSSLNNLANDLSTRFLHRGNDQDLDDAIVLGRDALDLCPVGHPDRSMSLDNLATVLSTRFQHRDNDQDLDEAIMLHRDALALRPVGHPDRSSSLNNLAVVLSTRFQHRRNDQDLDDAIMLDRDALASRPVGHPDRFMSLNNLAIVLSTRFEHRGNEQDLDEAIMLHRDVLDLNPVGHPDRSSSLNNLANVLSTRFERQHNREDLHESQEHLRCALTLLTQHNPRQLMIHQSLATVYLSFHRSELDGAGVDTDSLTAAMHHLKAAANLVCGGLLPRLRANLRWIELARGYSHGTELEAYATSMQLLDAYMSATASVSSRHNIVKHFPPTLAVDAASCALCSGDVCRAVELLEQGRTVIWTQMTRLRAPLDGLQDRGDHAVTLMKKFRDLSSLLDTPPTNHPEGTPIVKVEVEASRYRRLVEDWNRAVEEIRNIEGFSRFLLPPLFSDLQDAACDGPIVVLVASRSSCDAIIIPHKQPPTSIQLPTNLKKLLRLVTKLQQAVEKDAGPKRTQPELVKALRELWNDIVRPVVENLGGFAPPGSRIWWCPTGAFNFLPLHAAGEYKEHGQSLSQLYISSYTPSLIALIRARRSHDRSLSVPFAAIGQNHPAGHSFSLDCVEPELELVQNLLPPPPTVAFTKVTSVEATKSRALRALRDNTWLHFSCHGTQNFHEPYKSAFLMRDKLAFLSACETAVGNFHTPDEVIHLAASLQFAGVQSVVGTLWSVNDSTVQRLVEAFYKNLCGDGTMNSKRAARALHRAVQTLASDKDMPLDQRIVFMHIGI